MKIGELVDFKEILPLKYINSLKEGDNLAGIYYCKSKNELKTKTDKLYYSLILQDKTGQLDTKVWDTTSSGIGEFAAGDFIEVQGQVNRYQQALQGSLFRIRKCAEGEYDISDYMPVSKKNIDEMYDELLAITDTVKTPYLMKLLDSFFKDPEFAKEFKRHSAAKTIHHSFIGGLLEHSLGVTKICAFLADNYPAINRDLLITAAPLHDIGKMSEINEFPANDYSDCGQLLGHIYIGAHIIEDKIAAIPEFPDRVKNELIHCILAHHGQLEYGSPKLPALIEAEALAMADNLDAKMETFTEIIDENKGRTDWLGFKKVLDSNVRLTTPAPEDDK